MKKHYSLILVALFVSLTAQAKGMLHKQDLISATVGMQSGYSPIADIVAVSGRNSESEENAPALNGFVATVSSNLGISPLPVKLTYFKGQVQGNVANLSWSTAAEKDNERFDLERSQDGRDFSKIGEVKSKGDSNSANPLAYSLTDRAPVAGTNYYRLRQVATDGREYLSQVVALEMAGLKSTADLIAAIYPTVVSQEVTISLNAVGEATVTVLDAGGRPIASFANTVSRELVFPVKGLQSGIYYVRVVNGQNSKTQRFIKN